MAEHRPVEIHQQSIYAPFGDDGTDHPQRCANSSGWAHDVLVGVVLPHMMLLANLSRFGEVFVGCSLLLGLLSRLGALVGMLLFLSYMPVNAAAFHHSLIRPIDIAILAMFGLNLIMPTGRIFGLDALLFAPRPNHAVADDAGYATSGESTS